MSPIDGIGGISGAGLPRVNGAAETGYAPAAPGKTETAEDSGGGAEEVRQKKRLGVIECATCASRTYQDGSDDPGVSFKAPTKLSPAEAASAVPSHEREHQTREAAKAEEDNREVISNSIRIFTSVCPECGKTYVSGGVTTTVTKGKENDEYEGMEELLGIKKNDRDDPNSVLNLNRNMANMAYGLNYDERK